MADSWKALNRTQNRGWTRWRWWWWGSSSGVSPRLDGPRWYLVMARRLASIAALFGGKSPGVKKIKMFQRIKLVSKCDSNMLKFMAHQACGFSRRWALPPSSFHPTKEKTTKTNENEYPLHSCTNHPPVWRNISIIWFPSQLPSPTYQNPQVWSDIVRARALESKSVESTFQDE